MRFKSDVGSSPPPFKRVVRLTGSLACLLLISKVFQHFKKIKSKGDPIYVTADGYVLRSGITETSGSTRVEITLPYTNDTAVYQHADFIVKEGEAVKRGQIIGYMSDNGTNGQVHLHYEIRKNGEYAGYGGSVELVNPRKHMPSTYHD